MKAFISYSHKDESWLEQLHKHLAMLRREGALDDWYDRDILAGGHVDTEIAKQLEECEVFLALVSSDFLASEYCYERELARAIERHDAGEMRVVSIIVRPCDWQNSPLGRLKALPKDGKAISEWTNHDTAYLNIVTELRKVITSKTRESAATSDAETQSSQLSPSKYRIKHDYDSIDKSDFRDKCFSKVKEYFKGAITEIDTVEGIRGRFRDLGPTSFSCTILNQRKGRGEAHITVHSGTGNAAIGDITYLFQENAPTNTANGWFSVEADEYDLYIRWHGKSFGGDDQRVSLQSAAELLWKEFIGHAGIEYA